MTPIPVQIKPAGGEFRRVRTVDQMVGRVASAQHRVDGPDHVDDPHEVNPRGIDQGIEADDLLKIKRRSEAAPVLASQIVEVRGTQRIEAANLSRCWRERSRGEPRKVDSVGAHLDQGQLKELIGETVVAAV